MRLNFSKDKLEITAIKKINPTAFRLLAIATTAFIIWGLAGGWAWLAPLPETVQEQVDEAINLRLDGIIVYVEKAGTPPNFYAAGWKNREDQIPADPYAFFKIASISKLYIATAAAKLASNQSLSLDDTLAFHLPTLVGRIANADQITLRMLLQHRSGIPNYSDQKDYWSTPPNTDINENLKIVLDQPADFAPDTRYSYSNTNYLLIGQIFDKVLGYGHQEYISREILLPRGLTHTYGLLSQVDLGEVVSGYHFLSDTDFKNRHAITPGGSMVATAQDTGIFLRALNDGSLLNDDEQAIYSSIYPYSHTGWLPGYQSIARYYRDIDTVVIQFVNTTGGNSITMTNIIYNRIVKILRRE